MLEEAEKRKQHTNVTTGAARSSLNNFKDELLAFEQLSRINDRNIDVFKWWNDRSNSSQLLKETAGTVLSFPVTQVSVERLFSGLRFILNDQRGRLSNDTLKNIMFLRSNKDFDI
jgi:hAT family C-terminal dimerisation region